MPPNLKHRHHHVAQTYLRGWAEDEKVYVMQGGEIRRNPIRDVAVKRDFYKLPPLSDFDLKFLRRMIELSPERSRKSHENFLSMFGLLPTLRARMTKAEIATNPELVALLDEQILVAEEEFHAGIEGRVAPQIEAIRRGDVSFYADEALGAQFSYFLALQHFRTRAVKMRAIERVKSQTGDDITGRWNIMAHIMASNTGLTFYVERKRNPLVLLDNRTATPFITSDQPTVNLLGGQGDEAPEHLALYYPVSPTRAVLLDALGNPCGVAGKTLTDMDIRTLNDQVVRSSYLQIFAATREALEAL